MSSPPAPKAAKSSRQEEPKDSALGLTLEAADLVLNALKTAASVAPIPYLKEASELALSLLDTVKAVEDNKGAFQQLANDACGLVYVALRATQESGAKGEMVDKATFDSIEHLLQTISSIEKFARKNVTRNIVVRTFKSKSDLGKIQGYRDALRQELDMFGLHADISVQQNLARVLAQQNEIMAELKRQHSSPTQSQSDTALATPGGSPPTLPHSASSPIPGAANAGAVNPDAVLRAKFGNVNITGGGFNYTGGDANTSTVTNTTSNNNSGNTTTTTIKDAYNDYSVHGPGEQFKKKKKKKQEESDEE